MQSTTTAGASTSQTRDSRAENMQQVLRYIDDIAIQSGEEEEEEEGEDEVAIDEGFINDEVMDEEDEVEDDEDRDYDKEGVDDQQDDSEGLLTYDMK